MKSLSHALTALLAAAASFIAQPALAGCAAPMPDWDRNTQLLRYTPFYIESCPMVGQPWLDFEQKKAAHDGPGVQVKPYADSAQMLRDATWVVVARPIAAHEPHKPHAPTLNAKGVVFFEVESVLKGAESWAKLPLSPLNAARQEASYSGEGASAKYLGPVPYRPAFYVPALTMLPVIRHSPLWEVGKWYAQTRENGTPAVTTAKYITYPAQLLPLPYTVPELKALYLDEARPFPYQRYATAGAGRSMGVDLPQVLLNERYVLVLDAEGYAQNRVTYGAPRVEHVGTNNRWLNWVAAQLKTPN